MKNKKKRERGEKNGEGGGLRAVTANDPAMSPPPRYSGLILKHVK
jgi:hypothetical protein